MNFRNILSSNDFEEKKQEKLNKVITSVKEIKWMVKGSSNVSKRIITLPFNTWCSLKGHTDSDKFRLRSENLLKHV